MWPLAHQLMRAVEVARQRFWPKPRGKEGHLFLSILMRRTSQVPQARVIKLRGCNRRQLPPQGLRFLGSRDGATLEFCIL